MYSRNGLPATREVLCQPIECNQDNCKSAVNSHQQSRHIICAILYHPYKEGRSFKYNHNCGFYITIVNGNTTGLCSIPQMVQNTTATPIPNEVVSV